MMKDQHYSNHRRYYTPHHFIFYPVSFAIFFVSLYIAATHPAKSLEWFAMACVTFLLIWLSFMMRQHYALVPQNRIIRLELRLRYYQLTGKRFENVESKMSIKQIVALRFASDEELPALVDRTVKENLSPASIKKIIVHWIPDHLRV